MAQPALLSLIDSFVNPDNEEDVQTDALNQLLLVIHRKQSSLQDVVQSLGDYLTNVDDLIRSRGTLLLS